MNQDTICAISTSNGKGAIAVIRISGLEAINIINNILKPYSQKKISHKEKKQVSVGEIIVNNKVVDEVIVTSFTSPNSYTGENTVEISCHGSNYIQEKLIQILIQNNCRLAKRGEFTLRAFLNEKLDLSQAEGVAELIASENEKAHELAIKQMRGGFSKEIKELREKLVKFASLIELELDFSQEDVKFVNRKELLLLLNNIKQKINKLIDSFKLGNVIKNGIPVAIVGHPNSGKSTLLNKLLNEERAIVSDIKGTTRDTIEEIINFKGYKFRFIDTAGLRSTKNKIEQIGISKTYDKINESAFVLYMIDRTDFNQSKIEKEIIKIKKTLNKETTLIILVNKLDLNSQSVNFMQIKKTPVINISAKKGDGIPKLFKIIESQIEKWNDLNNEFIVISQRHFESLINTTQAIKDIDSGLKSNISGEFLSLDIKRSLEFLGEITGEISNEHLLDSIFQDFCIGK
ncbi:MAG: tRNA uridine-5-carboxymethylaminomethyl(34) synthesis GTPase MnmE [Flavobacteriales bacterium TMED191]|nr:MAG: tRNA uridine-5-carboxymethylaminomethyl(34) synthesis GTPase MnmE [Flavobacteriales bacterium TMED191]